MELDTAPIDAIITWVDGRSGAHRRARQRYMALEGRTLGENAANPHRWESSDEIQYCLRSIELNAPWIRRIWIVVDGDGPDLSSQSAALRQKVHLCRHAQLFHGFEDALPTFNSLTIESLLWCIPDLAERSLYFNDDVFLTAPLTPADVFHNTAPVLRGAFSDLSDIDTAPASRDDPALFNHFMQINAARLSGVPVTRVFASAHVVHPMRRSVMADLFDAHRDAFAANIAHRFRDLSQFQPQSLHNFACLAANEAIIGPTDDHLHVESGAGAGLSAVQMRAHLDQAAHAGIRFLCVNDLPQLEAILPDARDWLSRRIGTQPA